MSLSKLKYYLLLNLESASGSKPSAAAQLDSLFLSVTFANLAGLGCLPVANEISNGLREGTCLETPELINWMEQLHFFRLYNMLLFDLQYFLPPIGKKYKPSQLALGFFGRVKIQTSIFKQLVFSVRWRVQWFLGLLITGVFGLTF